MALLDGTKRFVPGETPDRRTDPRRKVSLSAIVLPVAGYADMRIVNVSRTGFGAETSASLQMIHPLIFSVNDGRYYRGKVRWIRGRKFGVDLDDALDVLGFSSEVDPGVLATHTARPRRYPIDQSGQIALGSPSYGSVVRDISRSGMRLELEAKLDVGQQVIISLPARPLIVATVRWCANHMAGVETAERIQTLRLAYASES